LDYTRRRRCTGGGGLAGQLAGGGQQGLLATKSQGKNYQIEKEATRISPEGSEGREERRRSGSAARAELRRGAPAAGGASTAPVT
jgi:hypothetical protein